MDGGEEVAWALAKAIFTEWSLTGKGINIIIVRGQIMWRMDINERVKQFIAISLK